MNWFRRNSKSLNQEKGQEALATAEQLQNITSQLRVEIQQIHEHLRASKDLDEVKSRLSLVELALRSLSGENPSTYNIQKATHDALLTMYNWLRKQDDAITPHPPLIQEEILPGTVLLPLEVNYQYELLFYSPLEPTSYASRIILNHQYTHVDTLNSTFSLHINAAKAPPGLGEALLLLNREGGPLFLGKRTRLDQSSNGKWRFKVIYWPCTGAEHEQGDLAYIQGGRYADDITLYFYINANAERFSYEYEFQEATTNKDTDITQNQVQEHGIIDLTHLTEEQDHGNVSGETQAI